jgi:predicted helicase
LVEAVKLKALGRYLSAVQKTLSSGYASEGSHYPSLKTLLESLGDGIIATSLPSRIECGAPDFIVTKGSTTIGYVEAKDVGKSLDEAERTEQLKRYLSSLSSLVLTDYLEFRWYVDGECRLKARTGTTTGDGKVNRNPAGTEQAAELLGAFLSHRAEGVGTPRGLAIRMARQAHLIRNLIINAFENEPESGGLHTQLAAFRDNLIPDLSTEYFADMYAQTIAYGLFAARCSNHEDKTFTRQNAAYLLPKTNPFLRKLFNTIAGPDLDDRVAWLVDDLAQVLAQADMEAILKDFGKRTAREDPVVHFYETFLKQYDPKIREMHGVYYTPEPVVSYIVRSIDHLLKTRFDRPMGLADEKTLILDPALGTATFLYMVINEVHQAIIAQGQKGLWNDYVAEKLLPRIFGFELLMAPYAVAHLKMGLLLQETGYEFRSDQRLGIYLTNTLEEAVKRAKTLFARWITEEANAAAEVKSEKPIMVVLGNPPYSVSSLNRSDWIEKLLQDYKKDLHEKKLNIDDDYIKFIRFGQWRIDQTGYGILGFITNNSYLDGLTHRRMREYLLQTFSTIYVLNLHGSSRRGEQAPGNIKDENVFDIQQGVAIGIFVKEPGRTSSNQVYYADVWGTRESKYDSLFESDVDSVDWRSLAPTAPHFFFVPKDLSLRDEYEQMPSTTDIFVVWQSALNTDRDELFLDHNMSELTRRIHLLFSKNYDDDFKERYRVYPSSSYDIETRRDRTRFTEANIRRCLHRPFDECFIYYDPQLTSRPVFEVMRHMLQPNLALISARQTKEDFAILTTSALCTHKIVTVYDRSFVFPLYLYPAEGEMTFEAGTRRPNLNPRFTEALSQNLGLTFVEDGSGDLEQTFGPEDIFDYAYAVLHSPTYRSRYAEFLKIDFPRLPLTSNKELFRALAAKGAELVSLHLMESPTLNKTITRFPIVGPNTVENVNYHEDSQKVYINKTQYFEGVSPEVWAFHIGGYQVCQKWLKGRKGRTLTYDELTHYQKTIVALKETIRLMAEIDSLIPQWPLI